MSSREVILIESAGSSGLRDMFKEKYPYPPLGILQVSSFLKMHGYTVHLLDMMMEDYSQAEFRRRLLALSADPIAVGISLYTDCFFEGLEIAAVARAVHPSAVIVMGGPHATFRPEEVLAHPQVDYVVRREGESAMVELLEHVAAPAAWPIERVRSVTYRDAHGTVRSTPDRPLIKTLDILPFPDYDAMTVLHEAYRDSFMLVSSRGCPGDCVFCASRAMSGGAYRFHSGEWVFSLAYECHRRYGFNRFVFLDDTFTVNRRRAAAFCGYLRECWPGHPPRWACKSRVDRLDDAICAEMAEAGCLSVHIGVESGDQAVLDAIAKHIRLDQTFAAIRSARSHGLRVDCSFIIGHHADTRETIEKTILFAQAVRDNKLGTAAIGVSTPMPGTRLMESADQLGVHITSRNWRKYNLVNPVYHTDQFSENDLRRALYFFEHESLHGKRDVGLTAASHEEFRADLAQLLAGIEADAASPHRREENEDGRRQPTADPSRV